MALKMTVTDSVYGTLTDCYIDIKCIMTTCGSSLYNCHVYYYVTKAIHDADANNYFKKETYYVTLAGTTTLTNLQADAEDQLKLDSAFATAVDWS